MLIQKSFVVWITGLPVSGKSSIAKLLEGELLERGLKVEILDESNDVIQSLFTDNTSISVAKFNKSAERLAFIANLLCRNDVISICATVSPARDIREKIRKIMGNFLEVYVSCPVEVCKQRDQSKKYIKLFENISNKFYEEPLKPEIIINSDQESMDNSLGTIIKTLELLGWIPKVAGFDYSSKEEAKIHERLESLGYL